MSTPQKPKDQRKLATLTTQEHGVFHRFQSACLKRMGLLQRVRSLLAVPLAGYVTHASKHNAVLVVTLSNPAVYLKMQGEKKNLLGALQEEYSSLENIQIRVSAGVCAHNKSVASNSVGLSKQRARGGFAEKALRSLYACVAESKLKTALKKLLANKSTLPTAL